MDARGATRTSSASDGNVTFHHQPPATAAEEKAHAKAEKRVHKTGRGSRRNVKTRTARTTTKAINRMERQEHTDAKLTAALATLRRAALAEPMVQANTKATLMWREMDAVRLTQQALRMAKQGAEKLASQGLSQATIDAVIAAEAAYDADCDAH